MSILETINKPYKIFADINNIDYNALEQFVSAMNHPNIIRGALMPDVHLGYSLPIGAVVETDSMIFPSFVGYDIGCGMCAVPTNFRKGDIKHKAKKIYKQILRNVPVGFNKHNKYVEEAFLLDILASTDIMQKIFDDKNGMLQVGTLGGGNHFIEIGYDENDQVWIIVHSGSRGVGHGCAQHYMKLASPTGKASEGHFGFDVESQNGKDYIQDMNWCLEFALLNRKVMIRLVEESIRQCGLEGAGESFMINRNHNHAESNDGQHWIHRKGATHAEAGMMGVIPGNMKDGSFIVRGKGNRDSLMSSSHGAGRVLGRRKAKEQLSLEVFENDMVGIVANVGNNTLDESPLAYKDIYEVMRLQKDMVEVLGHVKPIINVKG